MLSAGITLLCLVVVSAKQQFSHHSGCPTDWIRIENTCYRAFNYATSLPVGDIESRTWSLARFSCLFLDGDLVSIENERENQIVRIITKLAGISTEQYYWIGLQRTDRGHYIWSDGCNATYFNWKQGEPSEGNDQKFVVSSDNGWDDVRNDWSMMTSSNGLVQPSGYVCQRQVSMETYMEQDIEMLTTTTVNDTNLLINGTTDMFMNTTTTTMKSDDMNNDKKIIICSPDNPDCDPDCITPNGDTDKFGLNGSKGDKEYTNDKGDKGTTVDKGTTIDKGVTVDKVYKGDKGDKGDTGDKGDKGIPGNEGAIGEQGIQGDKGTIGDAGMQGDKGDKGDKGESGIDGMDGKDGVMGIVGATGQAGARGTQGRQGDRGLQGLRGPPGPPALSNIMLRPRYSTDNGKGKIPYFINATAFCGIRAAGIYAHPLHCWQFLTCGKPFGGAHEMSCYTGRRFVASISTCMKDISCIFGAPTYNHTSRNNAMFSAHKGFRSLSDQQSHRVDIYTGVTLALMFATVVLTVGVAKLFINARIESRKRRILQEKTNGI